MKKMNNKGFSLVELIVVVLIMAIIAVALAPQVMKWVENSRKSTDCNNYDSMVSAVNVALADEKIMKEVGALDNGVDFLWFDSSNNGKTGATWSFAANNGSSNAFSGITAINPAPLTTTQSSDLGAYFKHKIGEILGDDFGTSIKIKRTTDYPGDTKANCYRIHVTKQGTVQRVNEPGQPDSTTPYKDSSSVNAYSGS